MYDTPKKPKRNRCCRGCCGTWTWYKTLQVFALILAILILVVVILSVVYKNNALSLQRFCIRAEPGNVVPGPGEVGGLVWGEFVLDSANEEITYRFRYNMALSNIQAIHVRGPIQINQEVGNLKFALCGSPSTTVCDITSTPGEVKGTLTTISPTNTGVYVEIRNIRKEPWLYYIEVLTTDNPATSGALRGPITSQCGIP